MRAPRCASGADDDPPRRECRWPLSWEKTFRRPWCVRIRAAIDEPVVQTERAVAPEFIFQRRHAEAGPVRRARHFLQRIFGGVFGDLFLERPAGFHRARLLARPRADLAVLGTG